MFSRRDDSTLDDPVLGSVDGVLIEGLESRVFYEKRLQSAIERYAASLSTPFFGALMQYDFDANRTWACPGHQGGQMFRQHPVGQLFYHHMGENVFRDDICNAMVSLGDLLIHEGPALDAQKAAAKVFGADRTYFVLNGTSMSNKVVNTALLRRGDIVLFDRNNHKSNHHGALFIADAIPIYMEADRNAFGMVGPTDWDALTEASIRSASGPTRACRAATDGRPSGRSASPSSSSAPTTARSTTRARCWRSSGHCANTSTSTRPGPASARSIR
jgi:ornithine decarboxylase